jgi:hypothetical protein
MNDQQAKIIAASTFLEAQRQEMQRRVNNQKQAEQALNKTASPKGLMSLFPGLKLQRLAKQ